jgi:RNA polymerase sigma-70 factor, ECF subfamily
VEFYTFDPSYLDRLRSSDPQTERHFVAYFSELVTIKLRTRMLAPHVIDDLRQETFARVLTALRREGGIRQPERLGAYVNSVCNNVLLEHYRSPGRETQLDEEAHDPPDHAIDLQGMLETQESAERVRRTLDQLSEKDRRLLRAIFLEEQDKDAVCRDFSVDRDYLRVLLHRAKESFKTQYLQQAAAPGRRVGR